MIHQKIKLYLSLLISVLLITAFIYLRFIKERYFDSLYFFQYYNGILHIHIILFMITIGFILISSFILYFLLKYLINEKKYIPKNAIITFLHKMVSYIKSCLDNLFETIGFYIPNMYVKTKKLVLGLYSLFGHKEYVIIYVIYLLPYSLVSFTLLWEIFIYFRLKIFYYVMPLLTMPLILHFILYLVEKLISNLHNIQELITIKHTFTPEGRDHFVFMQNETKPLSSGIFKQYCKEYLDLYPLKGFLESFNSIENSIKPYIQILLYVSYFTGWFYVLCINLFDNIIIIL